MRVVASFVSLVPGGRYIDAGEVALPVSELELLFAEIGIGKEYLHWD